MKYNIELTGYELMMILTSLGKSIRNFEKELKMKGFTDDFYKSTKNFINDYKYLRQKLEGEYK